MHKATFSWQRKKIPSLETRGITRTQGRRSQPSALPWTVACLARVLKPEKHSIQVRGSSLEGTLALFWFLAAETHAFNKQALYTGYCVICHHFLKSRDSYCGWELTANCQMKLQNHQRKSNKWARLNHEDREAHTGDKSTEQWNRVTAVKVKEGLLLEREAVVIWMGNGRASLVTEEVLFIDQGNSTMAFV